MDVETLLKQAREVATVRRVFGEPIERDGVTVVPVAAVRGGGGGGTAPTSGPDGGTGENPDPALGGGWGMAARPVGAYVIRGTQVTWEPARDVNRLVAGGQLVAVALLLTVRAWIRRR
jgi:uncharacterized spore protein YtfJ